MRGVVAGGHRLGRGVVRFVVVALAVLALAMAAVPRAPAADRTAAPPAPASQDEKLAQLLRQDPVYVSDQLPRSVPRSWQPKFAALARRTGVPTYVLVLPSLLSMDDSLLAGVHDRLGKPGLYVLMSDGSDLQAVAFGVNADADDAETVATFSTPYDASPLRLFQTFVDTVREGAAKAGSQADALEARMDKAHSKDGDGLVPPAYISDDDRDNQSFNTGALMLGAPLFVLLFGLYAIRLLRRRRRPAPHLLAKAPGRSGRLRTSLPRLAVVVVAAALAAAIGLIAPHVYDQTLDGPLVRPTHADLSARIDRVAAGLAHDPVYLDPESPSPFTGAQLTELEHRIAAFTPGQVYVAAVPMDLDDESMADPDAFLTALHRAVGKPGVYTVADTATGELGVDSWGLKLEPYPVPESITDIPVHDSDDHGFPQRYDRLMTFLGKVPHASQPTDNANDTSPEPLDDQHLAPLFSGEFGDGLTGGAGCVLILFLAVVACVALGRRLARARRARLEVPEAWTGLPSGVVPPSEAPAAPSAATLRRWAQHAVDALVAEFAAGDAAGRHPAAYECLDAALLLVDRAPNGRIGEHLAPADLVAAIVLATAGQEEVAGRSVKHVCEVNPLHGRATGRRTVRPAGRPARQTWVCAPCQARLRRSAADLADRWLRLPAKHGTTPYEQAPGALPHVSDGIAGLIAKVKEYAHVQ
ncbi:hypothetical protein [Streptantibioticus silvisoli]|uniref:TPM domain-containing protein n=1 Tax=Streptantibioticus silvisoli TaxID=2705255 RepID=A0ABT6VRV5_9ACTN|nr:hypothetical protein [Streptantibioticus silvisoli]MDI5961216.1 hypothetical protein [Streptantibioticus silvisoli]